SIAPARPGCMSSPQIGERKLREKERKPRERKGRRRERENRESLCKDEPAVRFSRSISLPLILSLFCSLLKVHPSSSSTSFVILLFLPLLFFFLPFSLSSQP